jgi:uncharacterized Tic20 family protein
MEEILAWLPLIALVGAPLTSIIYLYLSWTRFKETIPFTDEYRKKKIRLIIAAVIAGILVTIYLIIMGIYGVKVYFADLLN